MDFELSRQDQELIKAAESIIESRYKYGKHHIGAAIRSKSGKIYRAVHLEANVGRISVCAEAIAIGKAVSEGDSEFDTIVAVRHPGPDEEDRTIKVVSPCGMCRELLSNYGTDIKVIYSNDDTLAKCNIVDLLPWKYIRSSDI